MIGIALIAGVLTLNDALRIFRERAFDVLIANETISGAQADVVTAGAVANPSISLSLGKSFRYDPSVCEGCSATLFGAGITDQAAISDTLTGKRRLRVAVARAALDATRRSRDEVERTVEFTLEQQVLSAELAKKSLAFAREAQKIESETLALVEKRNKAGAVSEADVARAEVQKLEADQAVEVAGQNYESAKAGVAFLLGYRDTPPDLDFDDELTRSGGDVPASRDALLAAAREHRPDLAAAAFQIERARSAVELAKRQRTPDFFPELMYTQQGTGQNAITPPTLTFSISAAPALLYGFQGEIAKAEADLRTQQTIANKIDAQIGSDVSIAYASFVAARTRLVRIEDRLMPRAALARDLVRLQYEKGAASLFEYLDAQRTFLGTQNEFLQNLNDYWTAVFQLEQATGMDLHR